jgi:caffeoyl-CoA O-methyltransferase
MIIKDIGFTAVLQDYCHQYFLREHPLLESLRQETQRMPQGHMQVTPLQGQFLGFLVKMIQAKNILEIGTYTGYSSLAMALNLPSNGKLITCDKNPEWTKMAKKYWQQAGLDHKIHLMLGSASESLSILTNQGERFDLILIDADKKNYENYYEQSLQLLKTNGLIVVDNVLWRGKIAENDPNDPTSLSIQNFNKKIQADNRIDVCLVPIGDGFSLIRKKDSNF